MQKSRIIFLSPHLDDVVYSCGGLVHDLVARGTAVEIWSIFTADPPEGDLSPFAQSLHDHWNEKTNPYLIRREEDLHAMEVLGCVSRHLNYHDCIYRKDSETTEFIIKKKEDLFSNEYKIEKDLVKNLAHELKALLPVDAALVSPLSVGGHIDHRVTRLAAESLGLPLWYYADFPYAANDPSQIDGLLPLNAKPEIHEISEMGIKMWQKAVGCYTSQISSFWTSVDEMNDSIKNYAALPIARTCWHKPD